MRPHLITTTAALADLRPSWEALFYACPWATLFQSPNWQLTWWHHFGREGSLRALALYDGDTLVGLAPFYITHETGMPLLRLVGGIDLTDYLDILARPGYDTALWDAVLDTWLGRQCECTLDLHSLRADSPTLHLLPERARVRHLTLTNQQETVCPLVSLPASWEAYQKTLSAKARHELRRKLRKAGREALVSWYWVAHPDAVAEDLPTFFHLHTLSSPEKAMFWTPARRAFFEAMALEMSRAGWLQLAFLLIDGTPAATFMLFDDGERFLLYNSGFDPAFDALSPGWVLLGYLIEHAIALGRREFDFLRGDEAYKYQFGAHSCPLFNIQVRPSHRHPDTRRAD